MKVLFLGEGWTGSNARSMANAFSAAGYETRHIDTTHVGRPSRLSPGWIRLKLTGMNANQAIHAQIDQAVRDWRPDILFCFKTIYLDQARLTELPVTVKIHYSPDDASNPANVSEDYLRHESAWDHVVTTKTHNVTELEARGVRSAIFVPSAYDPAWHHPIAVADPDRFSVGFIGSRRPDREQLLARLGEMYAGDLLVAGQMSQSPSIRKSGANLGPSAFGEPFSQLVGRIRSNLILLNSDNRDMHTCRSYEIPAAGGFFVGQRTDEHSDLLVEESECLLFGTEDELVDHLNWADTHKTQVDSMRKRGYRAILSGNNTYVDRVHMMSVQAGFSPRRVK